LNGCSPTAAKIVTNDSFCEGKLENVWLDKKDYNNLIEMRKNIEWKDTLDKIFDPVTLNEKEFDQCKSSK
jgi:hypothetical protein